MPEENYTEEILKKKGYVYDGECPPVDKHRAIQFWKWKNTDELIKFDPEKQKIIWRETDDIK
jgi:hypothetical protein